MGFYDQQPALDARNGLDKVFDTGIFDLFQDSYSKPSCKEGKIKSVCNEVWY